MSWEVLPSFRSPAARAEPAVYWRQWSERDGRSVARLNVGALELVEAIAADKNIGRRIGITVLRGNDDDEGKFALFIQPYVPKNPTIVSLARTKRSSYFAGVGLSRMQETGISLLVRDGDLLIGTLGEHYKDGRRKPVATKKP